MRNICTYESPVGELILSEEDHKLTGLWFRGQKHFPEFKNDHQEKKTDLLKDTCLWLGEYFSGRIPKENIPVYYNGSEFQNFVWDILCKIPYGETVTYGQIAAEIAKSRGIKRMSSQAVGGAVGRNKIGIIIPCHRVVGAGGSLTGYAGGIEKKAYLLRLEQTCKYYLI